MKYIVGVGNYSRFDDSIGIRVIEHIDEKNLAKGFEAVDLSANSLDLFSYLNEKTRRIVIVDSAKMGLKPGDYRIFTPEEVESRKVVDGISTHEGDILKTIEFAKETGYYIPSILFIGIEPKTFEGNMGLSDCLRERLDEYVEVAINKVMEN